MNTYKVKLINNNAQIIRVSDGEEEEIEHPYFPVKVAERITDDLNKGYPLNWDILIH